MLADFAKLRQHFVLFPDESGVERNGCFTRDEAGFDERHGEVEAFGERTRLRRALEDFVHILDDSPLDLDEVAGEFTSGPAAFGGAGFPLVRGNGVSSG